MLGMLGSIGRGIRSILSPARKASAGRLLAEEVSSDYKPGGHPAAALEQAANTPPVWRVIQDAEAMLAHPRVRSALGYYKSGTAGCTFSLEGASTPEVGMFALQEVEYFWRACLPDVQASYEWGRGGYEVIYRKDGDHFRVQRLRPFHPADARPLVLETGKLWGLRVAGSGARGPIELRAAVESPGRSGEVLTLLPAKCYWHAHQVRYRRWYGQPQLYGAWRPWRRLAGRDGAEEVLDGGVYRFAFAPPIGRYPAEDQPPPGPGGRADLRWNNRDKMREMLESLKSGGVVALSSRKDESGGYVWDLNWPERTLDVAGLIVYTDSLEKAITLGIGVFPELIEAAEVGSGYSGRRIPLEAFLWGQQSVADRTLADWSEQVLSPLLRWNFGPAAWARVSCDSLLKKLDAAPPGGPGGLPPEGGPDSEGGDERGVPGDDQGGSGGVRGGRPGEVAPPGDARPANRPGGLRLRQGLGREQGRP